MATEMQNFLDAVEKKNWYIAHDELTEILDNPDIDKGTVLSAIEDLYPSVVDDMSYLKMGIQPLKKYRPTVDDDDDFETGDSSTGHLRRPYKGEEQSREVKNLIERLREKLAEEERLKIEKNVAFIEAQHAAWAAAEGEKLKQKANHRGGKSHRKRKNKTTKKTKKRKTVKRRKSNKRRR
jgi:hypothetical protein